jgi:hypothetical protein
MFPELQDAQIEAVISAVCAVQATASAKPAAVSTALGRG